LPSQQITAVIEQVRDPCTYRVEEERKHQAEDDMQGLVVVLAAIQPDSRESWGSLEREDKAELASIFELQKVDLTQTVPADTL
jgi:hypothetical protein